MAQRICYPSKYYQDLYKIGCTIENSENPSVRFNCVLGLRSERKVTRISSKKLSMCYKMDLFTLYLHLIISHFFFTKLLHLTYSPTIKSTTHSTSSLNRFTLPLHSTHSPCAFTLRIHPVHSPCAFTLRIHPVHSPCPFTLPIYLPVPLYHSFYFVAQPLHLIDSLYTTHSAASSSI